MDYIVNAWTACPMDSTAHYRKRNSRYFTRYIFHNIVFRPGVILKPLRDVYRIFWCGSSRVQCLPPNTAIWFGMVFADEIPLPYTWILYPVSAGKPYRTQMSTISVCAHTLLFYSSLLLHPAGKLRLYPLVTHRYSRWCASNCRESQSTNVRTQTSNLGYEKKFKSLDWNLIQPRVANATS